MATVATPITTAELLAMPENGMERWLIKGEARERSLRTRNRLHSSSLTRVVQHLANWLDNQPEPRGQILTGNVGVRLHCNPDTTFGVDVIYLSASLLTQQIAETNIIDGIPTLAVEIPPPHAIYRDIEDRIDAFQNAGVPIVWVVNPHRKTVTIYRPDAEPKLLNDQQELSGEPHLLGFRVTVRNLF